MKKQGFFNKKIIIAYKFQSSAITGRSKTTPLQHGLYASGTNSETFTLIFSIISTAAALKHVNNEV
jgi:hypothetical protein